MPCTLVLRKSAYERGEARFMVFTEKLGSMPSLERRFHGKIRKAVKGSDLEPNAPTTFWLFSLSWYFRKK
jgi:hypothetical protein